MKTYLVFVASFLLAIGFASSQDHGHILPDDEFARLLFGVLDINRDGKITFEEMKSIFVSMDSDVDGHITKKEFITTWLSSKLGHANYGMKIFGQVDTDGDGLLDLVDIRRFYSYFDRDGDNKVNDAEFVTTWISMEHAL